MKLKSIILIPLVLLSLNLGAVEYKIYDFANLQKSLGYPNDTYFGASDEQIADLETYISKEDTYYKEINSYLRYFPAPYEWFGISPEQAKVMVENIDGLYAKTPTLPEDLILFRGVNLKYRKNRSFSIGEEITEKGYVSTSTTLAVAKHFAIKLNDTSAGTKKAVLVLYQENSDHKGILIDQNEDEVLLRRDQALKVMATKSTHSLYETYLVQVCKLTCEQIMNKDIEKFWLAFKG